MAKSKFDAVLRQRRTTPSEQASSTETPQAIQTNVSRGRRRPPGKRTNPDYQQVTAYITRALHDQAKIALIQEGRKEFSELIEDLLANWMNQRKAYGLPFF
jgi:hypothetical protein